MLDLALQKLCLTIIVGCVCKSKWETMTRPNVGGGTRNVEFLEAKLYMT